MKKGAKGFSKLLRLFWVLLFVYACYVLVQQQFVLSDLAAENNALNVKIADAKSENEELNNMASMANTDEYYEKIARRKLGFVKPNEKVFVDIANTGSK